METPPLTRGRRAVGLASGRGHRNTPAYAGKTALIEQFFLRVWKHPRLRGEDSPTCRPPWPCKETPPLTRGRHAFRRRYVGPFGNTPAYAGKT